MGHDDATRRERLLTLLYDALFDERGLIPWFDAVAVELGANAVGYSLNRFHPDSATLIWSGLEPDCVQAYSARYYSIDPWRTANASAPIGIAQCSDQLVDRSIFTRSEFGGDYCRRYKVVDFQSVLLERCDHRRSVLGATYSTRPRSFQDNLDLFGFLAPHARRVVQLQERQASLQLRAAGLEAAVEQSPVGLLVLSHDGRAVFENAEASRCLRANDGLGLSREGRLFPSSVLRAGLASLSRRAPVTLRVDRPSGAAPYVLVFAKVGPRAFALGAAHDAVLVHIVDPARDAPDATSLLRAAFSLTIAEARIALAVAAGASVKEAADELGVAYATARTQLLSVYAKTQTHRQSALVKLVHALGAASPRLS